MGIEDLYVYDVTILNPTSKKDRYQADVDDWAHPTETPSRLWITQTSRTEDNADRQAETSTWRVFGPPDDPITARSRIQWGDDVYKIVGRPFVSESPKTDHRHLEADIELMEG